MCLARFSFVILLVLEFKPEYCKLPPKIESIKDPKRPLRLAIIMIENCDIINELKCIS